jgi:hypothetical protein
MATPPFMAGPSGVGQPAPAVPSGGGQQQQPDQSQVAQLIAKILSSQQGGAKLAQPVPAPVPEAPHGKTLVGKHTGAANLGTAIGTAIQGAVHQQKQAKLAHAESQWNQMTTLMQDQSPEGKQKLNSWMMANQKDLKNMAKALNQDWLNPEKTDVWKQGLGATLKQHQNKQNAMQGIMSTFKTLIGKANAPRPDLSQDQSKQMNQEILSKAPTSTQQDPQALEAQAKAVADLNKSQADLTRAQTEAKDKYQIQPTGTGTVVAIDKSDPTKVIQVTDDKGNAITAAPKGVQQGGKVAMVNGVPIGVSKTVNGKVTTITPGDPNWTGEDAKLYQAATGATAASNATKDHRIQLAGQSRALSYMQSRMYPVLNADGTEGFANAQDIIKNPKQFAPLSPAVKVKSQQAIFQDLHYTAGQLNEAINDLGDQGFDAKSRGQLLIAMRSNDPHAALSEFLSSEGASTLTDKQVNYATAVVAATEGAMMLRNLGGMGAGSDTLREAIAKMIPSAGTPSSKYAKRQMELYQGQIDRLEKAVPRIPGGGAAKSGPPQGAVSIGTGKDGKDYYLDGSGKSLGPAN